MGQKLVHFIFLIAPFFSLFNIYLVWLIATKRSNNNDLLQCEDPSKALFV